ncbi:MAG: hypothetical protein R2711_08125 [Acidimicrobiales bacterium]
MLVLHEVGAVAQEGAAQLLLRIGHHALVRVVAADDLHLVEPHVVVDGGPPTRRRLTGEQRRHERDDRDDRCQTSTMPHGERSPASW